MLTNVWKRNGLRSPNSQMVFGLIYENDVPTYYAVPQHLCDAPAFKRLCEGEGSFTFGEIEEGLFRYYPPKKNCVKGSYGFTERNNRGSFKVWFCKIKSVSHYIQGVHAI